MPAWEFQGLQNVAHKHNWHTFISMQNYYNLLYREEEREMLPYCRHEGIGCLAVSNRGLGLASVRLSRLQWSPIARGVLARPWQSGTSIRESTDHFLDIFVNRSSDASREIVRRVEQVAKDRTATMATIAAAWCLSKGGVVPVVGLNSKERIDEMVQGVKLELTDKEIQYLEEPYAPLPISGFA